MQAEIAALLKNELARVYCDTCSSNQSSEHCDDCHRKMMNWGASQAFCDRLANAIVEKFTSTNSVRNASCATCRKNIDDDHCESGGWYGGGNCKLWAPRNQHP